MLRVMSATVTAAAPSAGVQNCPNNLFKFVCSAIQGRAGDQSAVGPVVQGVVEGIVLFAVILVTGRVIRGVVVGHLERRGHDPQIRTLVRNGLTVLSWALAVVGGLVAGGLPATYVLTFGGVFSLAVGLAFQDIFRNVLAGIFILLEKPFRIGDRVAIGDQEGVVRTINLRTTELRTADGRMAVLPNLTAFNGVILNSTAFDQRRYSLTLPLEPHADVAGAMRLAHDALAATGGVSGEPAPTVRPDVDAAGGRVIVASYWLDLQAGDPDAVRTDLLLRLWAGGSSGTTPGPEAPATATTPSRNRGRRVGPGGPTAAADARRG